MKNSSNSCRNSFLPLAFMAMAMALPAKAQDRPLGVNDDTFAQIERLVAFAEDACPADWRTICGDGRARHRALTILAHAEFCDRQMGPYCDLYQQDREWLDLVQYLIPPDAPAQPARPILDDFPAFFTEFEAAYWANRHSGG